MLRFLGSSWQVRTARVLAVLWAGFWIWFGLASGISEGLNPVGVLIHTAAPGLFFGVLVYLAWQREWVGGIVLLVMGAAIAVFYPLLMGNWQPFYAAILLTMALPPALAGALLVWNHRSHYGRQV